MAQSQKAEAPPPIPTEDEIRRAKEAARRADGSVDALRFGALIARPLDFDLSADDPDPARRGLDG